MRRLSIGLTALCLGATPLIASEDLCKNDEAAFEERLAACTALIEAGEGVEAWMYRERADVYGDAEDYDNELAELSSGLERFPDDDDLLADRAYRLRLLDRAPEALIDTTRLLEVEPEDYWNWHMHARVLQAIGAEGTQDDILASYGRSIDLKADYYFSRFYRAGYLVEVGRLSEGIEDYQVARDLRPFGAGVYLRMGDAYRDMGDTALAVRNWGIAAVFQPNWKSSIEKRIIDVIDPEPVSQPASIDFEPPVEPITVRYVLDLKEVDTTSDMERSIMAIAAWFDPPDAAQPEALAFLTREFQGSGDDISVRQVIEQETGLENRLGIPGNTFRALVPTQTTANFAGGPTLESRQDAPGLSALWPLEQGKEISGAGVIDALCPAEKPSMPELLLGCRVGMERVQVAEFEYAFTVVGRDTITVPLGRFDALQLRYREKSEIAVSGITQTREVENQWWFAPELGVYVQSSQEFRGKIMTLRATEILETIP